MTVAASTVRDLTRPPSVSLAHAWRYWLRNATIFKHTYKLSLLAWGTLTLQNASTGAVKCKTVAGVQVENPSGGGAGKGTLLGVASYGCVAPACESAGGKAEMAPEKLPWSSVLIEEAALFRDKLEGIGLRAICAAREQSVLFHGSLRPEATNGFLIGAAPSKLEFGAGSGSLESTVGAGELSGKMKLMGYDAEQLTQVRNP